MRVPKILARTTLAFGALALVAVGACTATPGATASPNQTVGAPSASPPLASPTPKPAAFATPQSSTSSEPFMRAIEPGGSVPATWLGSWYESSLPGFPWILRAHDPYCLNALSTIQDCMVWELGDGSGHLVDTGVVTLNGGNFAVKWIGGSCNNNTSRYSPVLSGTRLTLTWVSGTCNSGDYVFTRTGAAGAPTAPPQPTP